MEDLKNNKTIQEFINWYENGANNFDLSQKDAESLRKLYEKFKFLFDQQKETYNIRN